MDDGEPVRVEGPEQAGDGVDAQYGGSEDTIELVEGEAHGQSGPTVESAEVRGDDAGDEPAVEIQASGVSVSNPRVRVDSSMTSGQVTTWDCVWFGSYPQTEVAPGDSAYASLQSAAWDANGDATVDGRKYRRISKDDATYNFYWSDDGYGSATWRYFRYEPIKWRVLRAGGGKALVVSDVALDDQRYNANNTSVTWETSSVRSWLNGYGVASNEPGTDFTRKSFVGTAFSASERSAILTTDVANASNTYYGTAGGNDTKDKVFLLSEAEVYDASQGSRTSAAPTTRHAAASPRTTRMPWGRGGRHIVATRATAAGGFARLATSPTARPAWATTAATWTATAATCTSTAPPSAQL